ncbi:MAG: indoleacetamide hydrolase [Sphingomonadaceae bacterium]
MVESLPIDGPTYHPGDELKRFPELESKHVTSRTLRRPINSMTRDIKLIELGAVAAAEAIRKGAFTAEHYATVLLDRSEQLARLNAFITIDRNTVLHAAREADAAVARHDILGALHGIPIAVKDNIDVASMPATAGTSSLRNNVPKVDAQLVARLRAAGAIVLGKTNMHELAAGITTDNATFGAALNPYDEGRVPGGSSGGTAAAVGARLAPIGIGTDTGASNRLPAAFCGVVGFRPTTGRWPQAGLIPNSPTRDTAGPMARTVEDCALIDSIVTGDDDWLEPVNLPTLRFGIPRRYCWSDLDPAIASLAQDWLGRMRDAGITLIEAEIPGIQELTTLAGMPIGVFEHEAALSSYLAQAGSPLSFADVLSGVEGPDVKAFFEEMRSRITEDDYRAALDVHRPHLQQAYRSYFSQHEVDAIIFPTTPLLAPTLEEVRDATGGRALSIMMRAIRNTDPGSIAGIPGISIPGGVSLSGMPAGLELDGPAGSDRRLLKVASAVARLLPATPPPPIG